MAYRRILLKLSGEVLAGDSSFGIDAARVASLAEEVAEVVSLLCGDSARWFNGTTIDADGAGVFAFCGRYSTVGAKLSMARGKMTEPPAGAAPAVPL